jgi:PAS domain S-box-containing protein
MLGYRRKELLNLSFRDFTHPDDIAIEQSFIDEILMGLRQGYSLEKRYICKNGSLIWCNLTISTIFDADGKTKMVIAVVKDITDRKQAEQEVQFQANLLNQVHNAVICTNIEGRITHWNRFAETLYQWTASEVIGRSIMEVLTPPQEQQTHSEIFETLRQNNEVIVENLLQRKDGSIIPVNATAASICNEQGQVIGYVGVSMDISDRIQAEAQIQASLREKEVLLREIHHRVKNNLQIVSSLLHLQANRVEDPHVRRALENSWSRIDSMAWRCCMKRGCGG